MNHHDSSEHGPLTDKSHESPLDASESPPSSPTSTAMLPGNLRRSPRNASAGNGTPQGSVNLSPIRENDGDASEASRQSSPASPDYHPNDDRPIRANAKHTPKKRSARGSTVTSIQRTRARDADPNGGRCLFTNRNAAVEICHLLARATDHHTVGNLEEAWGLGPHELNIDSRYNLLFLRADWHTIFDSSRPMLMLIPELSILKKLKAITLKARERNTEQHTIAANLESFFNSNQPFKYHVLPMRQMKEPICRFPNTNDNSTHKIHFPPFPKLGPLESHVRPHFVVVNSGQKIDKFLRANRALGIGRLAARLQAVVPTSDPDAVVDQIHHIRKLFQSWASPDSILSEASSDGGSGEDSSGRDEGEEEQDQGTEDDQSGDESPPSDSEDDVQSAESPTPSRRGQRRQIAAEMQRNANSGPDSSDAGSSEGTTWVDSVSDWVKECETMSQGQWEVGVYNDDQVGTYANEPARHAPDPGMWDKWEPYWRIYGMNNYLNTSQYSSNDWAASEGNVFLPRKGGRCR